MSIKKNRPAPAGLEIPAAVTAYKKTAAGLASAMEALRDAQAAAAAWQSELDAKRQNVAHIMRFHGLTQVRTCGLLLSVDEEGLASCEDRFTTLAAD